MTFIKPQPTPALSQLYAQDQARGVQPLSFDPAPAPPAAATPSIRELMALDGPVDWEAEQAARLQRDRLERARIAAAELERIAPEDEQPHPAKKRKSWLR